MNTDEKNRYISEHIGWKQKAVNLAQYGNPKWWVLPDESQRCEDFDHLSNAFAYVVPWLFDDGLYMLIGSGASGGWCDLMSEDSGDTVACAVSKDIHQAICEAFIEYCRGKDDY